MVEKLFLEDNPLSLKEDLEILLSSMYCFSLIFGRWASDELLNVHSFILLDTLYTPDHAITGMEGTSLEEPTSLLHCS